MEITITTKTPTQVKYLNAQCEVRYWEDGKINGVEDEDGNIPCREGDTWNPIIDLESGNIINWAIGITAYIHYKVCDAGVYTLLDADKKEVISIDGYVPSIMCPEDNGYGDYVIMKIDASGNIANWNPDITQFEDE